MNKTGAAKSGTVERKPALAFRHVDRNKLVAPEGATVAIRQDDGTVRMRGALGYMPTILRPAQVGDGGSRRERRAKGKKRKK